MIYFATVKIMIISITRAFLTVIIVAGVLSARLVEAEESPHWSKNECQTCHVEATPAEPPITLQAEFAEVLCEGCHSSKGGAVECRHASNISVGNIAIADSLRGSLRDGRVVCSTCHDITL